MDNQQFGVIDDQSHQSRSRMLCEGEILTQLGSTSGEVQTYLQTSSSGINIPGEVISLIAMFLWVLSMLVEIRRATDMGLAVISLPLPKGEKDVLAYGDDFVEGGVIDSMSIFGKTALILTQVLPRLVIAGILTFGGQYFLASSTSVSDLVLNTCALEIVKDLDELLYAALMTKHSRKVASGTTLRPDPTLAVLGGFLSTEVSSQETNAKAFVSAQINMFVRIAMSVGFVVIGYELYLKRTVDHTKIADVNICGKDLDFAYADSPWGMPYFTTISKNDGSTQSLQCYFDAYVDMVRIRAGFEPEHSPENATLREYVMGTHSNCKDPGGVQSLPGQLNCPSAKYAIVSDTMAASDFYTSGFCMDQDLSFALLRTTCLYEPKYAQATPMISLLRTRDSCTAIQQICTCNGGTCTPGNLPTIDGISLDYDLLTKLRNVCPDTCGLCESDDTQASSDSTNQSQGQPPASSNSSSDSATTQSSQQQPPTTTT
jgi:hypothetical protein